MAHNLWSRSLSVASNASSLSISSSRFRGFGPGRSASDRTLTSHTDDEIEKWRRCPKCHLPFVIPKALPCLHTICLHCLRIHYQTVRMQAATRAREYPNKYHFYSWEGSFPCPICYYPCYVLPEGIGVVPTNKRLLRMTFKERLYKCIENHLKEGCSVSSQYSAQIKDSDTKDKIRGAACEDHEDDVSSIGDSSSEAKKDEASPPAAYMEFGSNKLVADCSAAAEQSVTGLGALQKVINSVTATAFCAPSVLDSVKLDESTLLHWKHVSYECRGREEELLFKEEDPCVIGHREARLLNTYDLKRGDDDLELKHPNAIAVNCHTGHLVVVDTTWNKALLYKTHNKPFSYKKFQHPIVDVCFYPPTEGKHTERFCAMGRSLVKMGIMVYTATFNNNPLDFTCVYQKNIRDVSGLFVLEPNILVISLCYANLVIHQINEKQFVDLASRKMHGIYYPTHITYTAAEEIVVADTGNHRFGVFYGPQFLAFDFYGEYGCTYGKFFYPMGLAADKDRHLYVCDANNYRVQVFNRYFQFESCPISDTFLMGNGLSQDVKPIDCAVNNKQNLIVLFRGRNYMCLQTYEYFEPRFLYMAADEIPAHVQVPEVDTAHPHCWRCYLCCVKCGCCDNDKEDSRPDRRQYQPIN